MQERLEMSSKQPKSSQKFHSKVLKDNKVSGVASQSIRPRSLGQSESSVDGSAPVVKPSLRSDHTSEQKTEPRQCYVVIDKCDEDNKKNDALSTSKVRFTPKLTPFCERRLKTSLADRNGRSMYKLTGHKMGSEQHLIGRSMLQSSHEMSAILPSSQMRLRSSSGAISTRLESGKLDYDDGYSSLGKHEALARKKKGILPRSKSVAASKCVLDCGIMAVDSSEIITSKLSSMSTDEELDENLSGILSHDDAAKQLNFDDAEASFHVQDVGKDSMRQHDEGVEVSLMDESDCSVSFISLVELNSTNRPRCSTARKLHQSKLYFSDVEPSSESESDCVSRSKDNGDKKTIIPMRSSKPLLSMAEVICQKLKPGILVSPIEEGVKSRNGSSDLEVKEMYDDEERAEQTKDENMAFDQAKQWFLVLSDEESLSHEPSKVYHHHKDAPCNASIDKSVSRGKIKKRITKSKSIGEVMSMKMPASESGVYELGVAESVVCNASSCPKNTSVTLRSQERRMKSGRSKNTPAGIQHQHSVSKKSTKISKESDDYTTVESFISSLEPQKKPRKSQKSSQKLQKMPDELAPDQEELQKMKELDDIAHNYELCIE